ncbi:hypothetical protein F5B18DRAFT_559372 [Nemania serpens]|nr:hypothetical protein F5B18DRAFT_559372 [Nemania serpens]
MILPTPPSPNSVARHLNAIRPLHVSLCLCHASAPPVPPALGLLTQGLIGFVSLHAADLVPPIAQHRSPEREGGRFPSRCHRCLQRRLLRVRQPPQGTPSSTFAGTTHRSRNFCMFLSLNVASHHIVMSSTLSIEFISCCRVVHLAKPMPRNPPYSREDQEISWVLTLESHAGHTRHTPVSRGQCLLGRLSS